MRFEMLKRKLFLTILFAALSLGTLLSPVSGAPEAFAQSGNGNGNGNGNTGSGNGNNNGNNNTGSDNGNNNGNNNTGSGNGNNNGNDNTGSGNGNGNGNNNEAGAGDGNGEDASTASDATPSSGALILLGRPRGGGSDGSDQYPGRFRSVPCTTNWENGACLDYGQ
jgi:hypothetical protein